MEKVEDFFALDTFSVLSLSFVGWLWNNLFVQRFLLLCEDLKTFYRSETLFLCVHIHTSMYS